MNIEIKKVDPARWGRRLSEMDKLMFRPDDTYEENDWKRCKCFVLIFDKKVIGSLALEKIGNRKLHLASIGILPNYQGFKLSLILMAFAVSYARIFMLKNIETRIRKSNKASIALHKKFGFKVVRKVSNFYHKPTEQGLLMKLRVK